jgi:hypothetical protein
VRALTNRDTQLPSKFHVVRWRLSLDLSSLYCTNSNCYLIHYIQGRILIYKRSEVVCLYLAVTVNKGCAGRLTYLKPEYKMHLFNHLIFLVTAGSDRLQFRAMFMINDVLQHALIENVTPTEKTATINEVREGWRRAEAQLIKLQLDLKKEEEKNTRPNVNGKRPRIFKIVSDDEESDTETESDYEYEEPKSTPRTTRQAALAAVSKMRELENNAREIPDVEKKKKKENDMRKKKQENRRRPDDTDKWKKELEEKLKKDMEDIKKKEAELRKKEAELKEKIKAEENRKKEEKVREEKKRQEKEEEKMDTGTKSGATVDNIDSPKLSTAIEAALASVLPKVLKKHMCQNEKNDENLNRRKTKREETGRDTEFEDWGSDIEKSEKKSGWDTSRRRKHSANYTYLKIMLRRKERRLKAAMEELDDMDLREAAGIGELENDEDIYMS